MSRSPLLGAVLGCAMVATACKSEPAVPPESMPPPDTGPVTERCEEAPDPGRVTLHRLNRAEYDNTLRDLVGDTTRPARDFPSDDHGHGFDNNADVLSMSPLLFEKYEIAAQAVTGDVLTPPAMPLDITFEAEDVGSEACSARGDHWVLCTNGEIIATFAAEHAGEYELSVRAWGQQAGDEPARMQIDLDRAPLIVFDVTATASNPAIYRTRTQVSAGTHTFTAAFINDFYMPEQGLDRNLAVDWLRVNGPFDLQPVSERRDAVIICDPAESSWDACATEVVTAFGRRAWRRPLAEDEVTRLVALTRVAQSENDSFDVGIGLAMQALLLSPNFVFRVELDPDLTATTAHPLTDHELASRLSYFLWSSMPDAELFRLADDGRLSDPAIITQQVKRMIRDNKANALVDNFAGQWLLTRRLEDVNPDSTVYPSFDAALQTSMRAETELFFGEFLRSERSVLDMLDADFSFINDRLATHYGIAAVGSDELQRVELSPDSHRGGLLTQGSLLTVNSFPKRTSPVRRGKWVLEQMLCAPPPPPPPGVENLIDSGEQLSGTLREIMERHREDPVCAVCHVSMDEIGFGLEEFDGIGRFRTEDADGLPIDSNGELPDGRTFAGANALGTVIKADPRTPDCMAERMFIYALGRGPTSADSCTLEDIVARFDAQGQSVEALSVSIATSPAFMQRRGESAEGGE